MGEVSRPYNLRNVNYCQLVYGRAETENIAEVFSSVDPNAATELLRSWREEKLSTVLPDKLGGDTDLPRRVKRFVSMVVRELRGQKSKI